MALLIPSIFSIGQRFILQTMVEDKMNKMRESLRLMSLTRISYTMSFIFIQGFFAVIAGLILMAGFMGDNTMFPDDPYGNCVKFGGAVILFALTQIPYCMALSTLFSDSKLANQIGGLLLLIPELIFLWLASQQDNSSKVMYALYWLPVMPACTIFTSLSLNSSVIGFQMINKGVLNMPLAWTFLILNLPFWIMVYLYLDAIMPSEYGISKHPCFCFKK